MEVPATFGFTGSSNAKGAVISLSSFAGRVPQGREADSRWKELDSTRRRQLLAGSVPPGDEEEAVTALGYARRMLERNQLWAFVGALSAMVVALALSLLIEGDLSGQVFVIAAGIGIGVGLGLEISGRRRGRKLARRAEEALSETD